MSGDYHPSSKAKEPSAPSWDHRVIREDGDPGLGHMSDTSGVVDAVRTLGREPERRLGSSTSPNRQPSAVQTCVVCGEPRYQKHAERCAGRPPYAIARDIVGGGDYERVDVLRLARAYLAMSGIRP